MPYRRQWDEYRFFSRVEMEFWLGRRGELPKCLKWNHRGEEFLWQPLPACAKCSALSDEKWALIEKKITLLSRPRRIKTIRQYCVVHNSSSQHSWLDFFFFSHPGSRLKKWTAVCTVLCSVKGLHYVMCKIRRQRFSNLEFHSGKVAVYPFSLSVFTDLMSVSEIL